MHMAADRPPYALVSMMVIKRAVKILTVLLLLGACVYGGYLLVRESDVSMPSLFPPPSGMRLLMDMDGFRIAQSENGRVSWRMNARNADLFENKEAQLKELEIIFSNEDNKEATLTGDFGTMDTVTGNASLRKGPRDVRIVTSDGYVLTTDALYWKAGERIVWTSNPFKLLGSEIYLEGVGFTANVDIRSILVKDNVKAVLQE